MGSGGSLHREDCFAGEVPKWSQRRRLEIGWSGNSGTWVRIPPSPPVLDLLVQMVTLRSIPTSSVVSPVMAFLATSPNFYFKLGLFHWLLTAGTNCLIFLGNSWAAAGQKL
jgi:hypothetical protein